MRAHVLNAFGCVMVLGLAACGQQAQPEQTVVSTASESLTLSTATAERLAGHYVRDGVRISFDSIRTAAIFRFEIKAADGRVIIRGDKTAEQKYTTSVLDNRLNMFDDLAATENNVSYEGDQTAMDEAQKLPEYAALPWMSRALGEHGYNGRDYPAALAMHMFNKGVAEKLNITIPKIENRSELADEGGYCTAYPNSGNQCYGMCGRGCSCWSFVCGDCCYHNGCARHDDYCRGSGFWDTAKCWTNWGAAFFGC
jgi:hypothetical protein